MSGWKPGQSGNPAGRPRSGNALSEAIRRKVDPEVLAEKLWEMVEKSPNDQVKLRAIELLAERAWKKPAQVVEVGPADPYEDLSDEELAQLEASAVAELAAGGALALPEGAQDELADVVEDAASAGVSSASAGEMRGGLDARRPPLETVMPETRTTASARGSVFVRRKHGDTST